ncbi:hypothetical protein PR202_ga28304 [Eleusine coracana subsp. coracana]|uniref:C2H2-type domain-containing protein n=1 Tax=Eleusine coracana subsp. coracana TaxID=191504 RepID=A0AAV5DJE2_ELECO|nr:hypothetical protein PR202_ga28304 [Eleusine coracana subsp. coracana]
MISRSWKTPQITSHGKTRSARVVPVKFTRDYCKGVWLLSRNALRSHVQSVHLTLRMR